eukprot:TRINITY_DN236_c0_g2_i3.p1 TRINITY_DN236_c0_g2~~TRINITY_DN236_c0_g2_i3.p1  ORF type:complete len:769 (-),score=128.83 TRINITY_DN236_c0_g2_i3:126-2432(-)
MAKVIHRLTRETIDRIAAGEVLQRPSNAVKELLENSMDAGATSINISAKDGGLKFLQIRDNGSGIRKEDLPIVCERFTTSKLQAFSDLESIETFGFRGEALASITHVAHLSITTMTENAKCAWKAFYKDGKLVNQDGSSPGKPIPSAGLQGTTITIEDLFFNTGRKKMMKNTREEYVKIVQVVTSYSLHYSGVSFSLRQKNNARSELQTATGATVLDNIRNLFGPKVARELVEVEHTWNLTGSKSDLDCLPGDVPDNTTPTNSSKACTLTGYMSKPSYHARKQHFILFINHRLVDCRPLKIAIDRMFSEYLPKACHPFIYLDLRLPANIVDVNVHPTKSEVRFLGQDSIIEEISQAILKLLQGTNTSRNFYTQSLLTDVDLKKPRSKKKASDSDRPEGTAPPKPVAPHLKVRTDSKTQRLTSFFSPVQSNPNISSPSPSPSPSPTSGGAQKRLRTGEPAHVHEINLDDEEHEEHEHEHGHGHGHVHDHDQEPHSGEPPAKRAKTTSANPYVVIPTRSTPLLTSISQLYEDEEDNEHRKIADIFRDCTYVGGFDGVKVLVQHQTELFILDFARLSPALFYQEALLSFAEFNAIKFDTPAPSLALLTHVLRDPQHATILGQSDPEAKAKELLDSLLVHRTLLHEYCELEFDEYGALCTIPQIVANYVPALEDLAIFLLRLATQVDFSNEKPCLKMICRHLAWFYRLDSSHRNSKVVEEGVDPKETEQWKLQHILLPFACKRFRPPQSIAKDGSVVRVASLEKLYKVFERC